MTAQDQMHINAAYASIKAALDEIAMARNKDRVLEHMQNKLYAMEDTLYEYVAPIRRAE